MSKITINRTWLGSLIALLILFIISIGILGIYSLHTSPILLLDSELPLSPEEHLVHKVEKLELDSAFFLRLPEFFTLKEEARWWQMQESAYNILSENSFVSVVVTCRDGITRSLEASVGFLSIFEVIKKTWLIYLAALIYIISAVSVFKKHHSMAGLVLAFFLLSGSLYLISSTPVASREISIYPPYLKIFIGTVWISAGGMITLVYFSLIFPKRKRILERFSWIPYLFYGYFSLKIILYLILKVIPFGATFPFVCLLMLIMIAAFTHSLIKEDDSFLRKQI